MHYHRTETSLLRVHDNFIGETPTSSFLSDLTGSTVDIVKLQPEPSSMTFDNWVAIFKGSSPLKMKRLPVAMRKSF